jgi:putative addiction module antidote
MIQQAIQIGNSVGVIIPKSVLAEKNIKVGDKIQVDVSPVKSIRKSAMDAVSPELLMWLDGFNKRYKDALQELASK